MGTTNLDTLDLATALQVGSVAITATPAELNRLADVSGRLVAGGATLTVSEATHDGKVVLFSASGGTDITLPAATGSGALFRFVISVLASGDTHTINCAGNDLFCGAVLTVDSDTAGTVRGWVTAADTNTITLNAGTSGSKTIGEWLECLDVAADKWAVTGVVAGSGDGATPFSAV